MVVILRTGSVVLVYHYYVCLSSAKHHKSGIRFLFMADGETESMVVGLCNVAKPVFKV